MPSILFGQKATPVQRTAHCSYDVEFINIGNVIVSIRCRGTMDRICCQLRLDAMKVSNDTNTGYTWMRNDLHHYLIDLSLTVILPFAVVVLVVARLVDSETAASVLDNVDIMMMHGTSFCQSIARNSRGSELFIVRTCYHVCNEIYTQPLSQRSLGTF
jgi:hypothetical protein